MQRSGKEKEKRLTVFVDSQLKKDFQIACLKREIDMKTAISDFMQSFILEHKM